MELQIVLPNEATAMDPHVLVELAQAAEALGYRTAWLPDHVMPPSEYGPTYGGVYEPLVTIAHLAAVTHRLRLGTSVLVAPLRNPFVLAKQVATLQQLSGGRFVLGIGAGWSQPEFATVGADYATRGATTDDALAVLTHLLGGGTAPYDARRFAYGQGVFAPVPDHPVPVMIGGGSPAALRRAARFGDIWQGIPASPDEFTDQVRTLHRLPGGRRVVAAMRLPWADGAPADQIADQVRTYRGAGAENIAVHLGSYRGALGRLEALARVALPR